MKSGERIERAVSSVERATGEVGKAGRLTVAADLGSVLEIANGVISHESSDSSESDNDASLATNSLPHYRSRQT